MPPFIEGLKSLLGDAAEWMLYLVPAVIILIIVSLGMQLYQSNDPHEVKEIKAKGKRNIAITAVIGSATWISNYVWGLFA